MEEEKARIIGNIISHLRATANLGQKPFDEGDVFFSLAFKTDEEIRRIAKLCGFSEATR